MEETTSQQTGILHNAFNSLWNLPVFIRFAFVAGLILRLIIVFNAPLYEEQSNIPAFNDEVSHFNHVLFKYNSGNMPSQRMAVGEENALIQGEVEYSQPPLYYQISALVLKIYKDHIPRIRLLRLTSTLYWYGALFLLAMLLNKSKLMLPILLAGSLLGAGMVPSTTINNDSLFALYIAGVYGISASLIRTGSNWVRIVLVSILAALGLWIKISALVVWPMLFFAVFYNYSGNLARKSIFSFAAFLLSVFITLPLWIQRNITYGSPLGYEHSSEGLTFNIKEAIIAAMYSLQSPWMELWGSYWVKISALAFVLLIIASIIILIIYRKRIFSKLDNYEKAVILTWSIGGISGVAGWLYYAIKYFQADTRLLLPASIFLSVLIGWSLWYAKPRYRQIFGWGLNLIILLPYLAWGIH